MVVSTRARNLDRVSALSHFWRTTLVSISVILCLSYAVCLFYLSTLGSREAAYDVLHIIKSGYPLQEKDYAGACNTPNWMGQVRDRLDIFVLGHVFGWMGKMMAIGDLFVVSVSSVLFEVLELCYKHLLPNFHECWWDSVIMDMFGCNLIGIICGWAVLQWHYKRHRLSRDQLSVKGWKEKDLGSWVACLFLLFSNIFIDLTLFFVKHILHVETNHWVILLRTGIFGLMAYLSCIEMYEVVKSRIVSWRTMPATTAGFVALFSELAVVYAYGTETFAKSSDMPPKYRWILGGLLFLLFKSIVYVWHTSRTAPNSRSDRKRV